MQLVGVVADRHVTDLIPLETAHGIALEHGLDQSLNALDGLVSAVGL